MNSPEMTKLLKEYLTPMINQNIDYLVLGCTHYPYLIPQIKKLIPQNIKIIDSGDAVARQTKSILENKVGFRNSLEKSSQIFYTNANPKVLTEIVGDNYTVIKKDF